MTLKKAYQILFPKKHKEAKTTEKTNWKHFNTNDLKRCLTPALRHPAMRNNHKIQDMESQDEQVDDTTVVSQIEEQNVNNKRIRDNSGGCRGTRGPDRRRPTATLVRTLASNALAEKYEYLADKKNIIADHTIKKIERERLQAEEEHRLRKECLQLDVEIKRKQLEKLSLLVRRQPLETFASIYQRSSQSHFWCELKPHYRGSHLE
ncbi:hypothetical protein NQ315_003329 [Exocentrus adspersus]|uniref:No apical meristem-associated C-terminal domain-containing protein n=1 Tax=Exocentrus adspersus TaxID=1586481 RepID=A0AAV8VCG8_9CUCU|nr:hypothetical protein NQ315_003329 [Exocentrus adspersus]